MKKFAVVIALSVGLVFVNPVGAQSKKENRKIAQAEKEAAQAAAKHKAIDFTGTLREDGERTIFINEETQQRWTIANPDMLLGHESSRVKVKATPDIRAGTLLVEEVKDLKPLKQAKNEEKPSKKRKRALIF